MTYKIIGAVLIVTACGGFGFRIASAQKREERSLRQLISLLDFMECELQYRLTPLPTLCQQAAQEGEGVLRQVFLQFSRELNDQISPDVQCCMTAALNKTPKLPEGTKQALYALGKSLGRFDLGGQIKGLEAVRQHCRLELEKLCQNQDVRLRSYRTLGLCAGAAVAILLI